MGSLKGFKCLSGRGADRQTMTWVCFAGDLFIGFPGSPVKETAPVFLVKDTASNL